MAGARVRPGLSSAWSENALTLLRLRYLRRDLDRRIVERPHELVQRVARTVAEADGLYSGQSSVARATRLFAGVISRLDFLPNSPVLMNAGTPLGQLFACFVLPVEDSLDGIFDALRATACIQQAGGGTGFSFSRLRPRGDLVASTRRPSSGAVSFIGVFDRATEVITSGGIRRQDGVSAGGRELSERPTRISASQDSAVWLLAVVPALGCRPSALTLGQYQRGGLSDLRVGADEQTGDGQVVGRLVRHTPVPPAI